MRMSGCKEKTFTRPRRGRGGSLLIAKNLGISYLLDFYGDMLTEKQRDAVELYYNEDLSLAEIAEHSGITRQGVRDSIKRAEAQLFEYEARLHLAARFRRFEQVISAIRDEAMRIERYNDRFGGSSEIDRSASRIRHFAAELEHAAEGQTEKSWRLKD